MKRIAAIGRAALVAAAVATNATLPALAETVEIYSAADWDKFAKRVNDGANSLNAILMRDVTLTASSPRCGTSSTRYYKGEFNGNGKTLTVAFNVTNAGSGNPAAPFPFVTSGANFHDLHVAGTIQTDGKFAAGIGGYTVGASSGDITITRCRVSATITCTMTGDTTSSGIFACAGNARPYVTIRDCLFDGRLLGPNAYNSGGLVGWRNGAYVYTYNCLFNPTEVTLGASGSYTIVRPSFASAGHYSSTYYTQSFGTAQGTSAATMDAATLAARLGANWQVVNGKAVPKMVVSNASGASSGVAAFTYQGQLRDSSGLRLSEKNHTITFRLYDQAAGGSPHWGRKCDVLLDDDGNFAVELADTSDAAATLADGTPATGLADVLADNTGTTLYLGLSVGSNAEISPRQRLIATPFATCALDGVRASGNLAVAGAVAANGMRVTDAVKAGKADVSGAVSAATADVSGDATVKGNLTVNGTDKTISGGGAFPKGGIMIWSGAQNAIPVGWALCNGQTVNGYKTPDLRARFVVSAGNGYNVGNWGGAAFVTLTESQMPRHRHSFSYSGSDIDAGWKDADNIQITGWAPYMKSHTDYTAYSGGGQSHENRPPYYALCYIMRVR